MIQDPASLDRLRDIAQLEPVSWWPLAPGWWVLLSAMTVAAFVLGVYSFRRWKANAYRRSALAALQSATTVAEIDQLLKRTALAAFPRARVAPLYGKAWCDWLGQTAGMDLAPEVVRTLALDLYRDCPSTGISETTRAAAFWIKHHRVCRVGDKRC